MNKTIITLAAVLMTAVAPVVGQTYAALWNQVRTAEQKDLPKTKIAALRKIEAKAAQEKVYGQLLKAETDIIATEYEISPDSIEPAVERLRAKEKAAADAALRAVYRAI